MFLNINVLTIYFIKTTEKEVNPQIAKENFIKKVQRLRKIKE